MEEAMLLKMTMISAALLLAAPAMAQNQQNEGAPAQAQPQTPGGTPQAQGERPMQDRNVSMPNGPAGPHNSTGNMNTKGAGKGTTGTGGPGGSGNE
jgi:hypothetical protein